MQRQPIPVEQFQCPVVSTWATQWFLLTAGRLDAGAFNPMTVSWGGWGCLWNKPMALVVVRPSRHTYGFMEQYSTFTLCAFPPEYRDALTLCGTRSGRAVDKVRDTGLTPVASTLVEAPGYEEAELILECRKMYADDIRPAQFLADHIEPNYKGRDYHRFYMAEILAIHGTPAYAKAPGPHP